MRISRLRRWTTFRIADLIGVAIGCIVISFMSDRIDFIDLLLAVPIMYFSWYLMTLYLPLTALSLLIYFGQEIPDKRARFLMEIGFFIIHSIIATYFVIGDRFFEKDSSAFIVGWFCVLICNIVGFLYVEKRRLNLKSGNA